ncbi:photosystem I P700 chlorophyll a apoprotein [Trifolium medium]|uniref:Photosystem I P700 chlorophyll a apoprotein n=1 Tax=Trifolium medium TaxID=97028 RepID=A0A392MQG9_9FABA|nr:photosystem I P700 chlorophyll a apoprotein [Trifolium medium]
MQEGWPVLSIVVCQSTLTEESCLPINMKLQNDGDVRIMFSIFYQYNTKGPIELDSTLVAGSVQDICTTLIRPRTFKAFDWSMPCHGRKRLGMHLTGAEDLTTDLCAT